MSDEKKPSKYGATELIEEDLKEVQGGSAQGIAGGPGAKKTNVIQDGWQMLGVKNPDSK